MNYAQERAMHYSTRAYQLRICGADQPLVCNGDLVLYTSTCVHDHKIPMWLCTRHARIAATGVITCALCWHASAPAGHDDCVVTFTLAATGGSVRTRKRWLPWRRRS